MESHHEVVERVIRAIRATTPDGRVTSQTRNRLAETRVYERDPVIAEIVNLGRRIAADAHAGAGLGAYVFRAEVRWELIHKLRAAVEELDRIERGHSADITALNEADNG